MAWDYRTEVLADLPYIYWKCADVAGPIAKDDSGNSRDGTYFGTDIAFGEKGIHSDEVDTLVSFNPSASTYDAGIIYNPVAAGFPSTNFTLEWVGRDFTTGAGRTLWSYSDSGGVEPDTIRVIWSNFSNRLDVIIDGVQVNLSSFTSWTRSSAYLHHYALTWRSSDGRIQWFNNGRLMDTNNVKVGFSIPDLGSLVMCQDQDLVGGGYVVADALKVIGGEFAVYDTVLSDARIRVHASAAMTRYIDVDELSLALGADELAEIRPFRQEESVVVQYYQRIWNSTSGQFHYYTETAINMSPAAASVEPVAPDTNWDSGRHAVVEQL